MYSRPLVPRLFRVPDRVDGRGFHLRMLTVHDVVKDYAAVMESEARLVHFMDPHEDWPRGLTIQENLIDLGWHQREFTLRHSFAYTVMNDDESLCAGCCYIYPSSNPRFDAMAQYWGRTAEFDSSIGAVFRRSLASEWPFSNVAFPGRDITWADWQR